MYSFPQEGTEPSWRCRSLFPSAPALLGAPLSTMHCFSVALKLSLPEIETQTADSHLLLLALASCHHKEICKILIKACTTLWRDETAMEMVHHCITWIQPKQWLLQTLGGMPLGTSTILQGQLNEVYCKCRLCHTLKFLWASVTLGGQLSEGLKWAHVLQEVCLGLLLVWHYVQVGWEEANLQLAHNSNKKSNLMDSCRRPHSLGQRQSQAGEGFAQNVCSLQSEKIWMSFPFSQRSGEEMFFCFLVSS